MDQFEEHQLRYDPNRGNLVAPDGRDAYSDGKGGYIDSAGNPVVSGHPSYTPSTPAHIPPAYTASLTPEERRKAWRRLRHIGIFIAAIAAIAWGADKYQNYARGQEAHRQQSDAIQQRMGPVEYKAVQAGLDKWSQYRNEQPTLLNLTDIPGVKESFGFDYKGRSLVDEAETAKAVFNDLSRDPSDPLAQSKAVQCLFEPGCSRGLLDPRRAAVQSAGSDLLLTYGRALADFERRASIQRPVHAQEICRTVALAHRSLSSIGFPGFSFANAARKAIRCNEMASSPPVEAQSVKEALAAYSNAGGSSK